MENPVKVFTRKEHFEKGVYFSAQTLKIYYDDEPQDPRTEWDQVTHMICFHRRYNLGDKHDISSGNFSTWDELETHLIDERGATVILPLYLYDHSGITMSTRSFSCQWDSGQVGFIYMTDKDILDCYGGSEVTKEIRERAYKILEGDVKDYDNYLTGNVYGYILEDADGNHIDSCWGFYGDDAIDYIKQEVGMNEVN